MCAFAVLVPEINTDTSVQKQTFVHAGQSVVVQCFTFNQLVLGRRDAKMDEG